MLCRKLIIFNAYCSSANLWLSALPNATTHFLGLLYNNLAYCLRRGQVLIFGV